MKSSFSYQVRTWSVVSRLRRRRQARYSLGSLLDFVGRRMGSDIVVRVGSRDIQVPWDHRIADTLAFYPSYESEIGRIAARVAATDGRLAMIDVGANVGDTLARLPELPEASFLCVEGSSHYARILERNYGDDPRVTIVEILAGRTESDDSGFSINEVTTGTGHASVVAAGGAAITTLDALGRKHPVFSRANFLKIDTDGFELAVLQGAATLLRVARPVLHFEVSPRHWRDYGHSSAEDAFKLLADAGYPDMLIYDKYGYLVGRDLTAPASVACMLARHALRAEHAETYYNFVAFPKERPDREVFYAAENAL